MSTSSSNVESVIVLPNKRKRFQFEVIGTVEKNFDELLVLAAQFCGTIETNAEADFKNVGKKLPTQQAVPGQILMFPTEKEDEGEQLDDKWAITSNWVLYTIDTIGEPTLIKLIGTVFPTTSTSFREGHMVHVNLPDCVLQAVGKTEAQGRMTLNEDMSMDTEGEKKTQTVLGKSVSLYGIPDLDNEPRLCSLKNEGIKRMVKVAGMIRLMGMDRFERMVVDLLFCKKEFTLAVNRYAASAVSLPSESPFKSFIQLRKLEGLPIVDNPDVLEKFVLGNYPLHDRTTLSLLDFVRYRVENFKWGQAPTNEGRTIFLDAFTNLQKVLVVYFGKHFATSCEEVLDALKHNDDIFQYYDDAYIQIRFEMSLSKFFQDVYKEKTSLTHPEITMDSPQNCVSLLAAYFHEEIQGANRELTKENNWEPLPHSHFYSKEGLFRQVSFKTKVAKGTKNAPAIPDKGKTSNICIYHLGNQMNVIGHNGVQIECRSKPKCVHAHKSITGITKAEAYNVINGMPEGRLKKSYELQMKICTGFKPMQKKE